MQLVEMKPVEVEGKQRLTFIAPSRGLIGFRSRSSRPSILWTELVHSLPHVCAILCAPGKVRRHRSSAQLLHIWPDVMSFDVHRIQAIQTDGIRSKQVVSLLNKAICRPRLYRVWPAQVSHALCLSVQVTLCHAYTREWNAAQSLPELWSLQRSIGQSQEGCADSYGRQVACLPLFPVQLSSLLPVCLWGRVQTMPRWRCWEVFELNGALQTARLPHTLWDCLSPVESCSLAYNRKSTAAWSLGNAPEMERWRYKTLWCVGNQAVMRPCIHCVLHELWR